MNSSPKHTSKLRWLSFGAIKPSGWIRAQMAHDLEHGFVGHLDELVPSPGCYYSAAFLFSTTRSIIVSGTIIGGRSKERIS